MSFASIARSFSSPWALGLIKRTTATEVHTSLNTMIQSSTTNEFSCWLMRLKANMQSTRARERKIRLSRIVIDRMRRSRPFIYAAIAVLRVLAWVVFVSSYEPYLRIEIPRTRKEMPVKVRTHLSNRSLSPDRIFSLSKEKIQVKQNQYLFKSNWYIILGCFFVKMVFIMLYFADCSFFWTNFLLKALLCELEVKLWIGHVSECNLGKKWFKSSLKANLELNIDPANRKVQWDTRRQKRERRARTRQADSRWERRKNWENQAIVTP